MLATVSCLLASGEQVAIAMFVCLGVMGVASVIANAVCKTRKAAYTARLKQLMIERGMSAGEIDQVVRSQPDNRGAAGFVCRTRRDNVI